VRRNGDYVFALVPAPYYEGSEDIYIQQITKTYLNKGAMPTTWNEPLGLPTEIVPLNKPYQVFAGGAFTGQLLSEGKPAAGVECEIEYINTDINLEANAFSHEPKGDVPPSAIVAITDANGLFTFGIPGPGVWGFACLGSGPDKEHEGKELSQDAVIWINASPFSTVGERPAAQHSPIASDATASIEDALSAEQRRAVQGALRHIGIYTGPIDGDIGPRTREALKTFQRAHGLADSGQLDQPLFDTLTAVAKR
ncbi:MAG: DUF4198 domain-containing protein, partial [Chromatiaceae bacterium]|nr:DUF4198 domain-containing protein [Chromatiaceae bacterium]